MAAINGPYTAGSVISSSVVNARFSDIETEITDSASRSGKGGFTSPVRGADGVVTAPTFAFTSETGTGLYRIGSSDLGVAINQSKKLELTSSLFTVTPAASFSSTLAVTGASTLTGDVTASGHVGIGAAPTNFLDMTITGTATTNLGSWLQASLADGNSMTLNIGKASSAGGLGILTYKKNATAVNSTFCLDVYGGGSTLCVDGNGKTIIGSSGTGISNSIRGTASLTPGSVPSLSCLNANITVTGAAAGADCAVGAISTLQGVFATGCIVTANTCAINVCNVSAGAVTPPTGTYACRVFNP